VREALVGSLDNTLNERGGPPLSILTRCCRDICDDESLKNRIKITHIDSVALRVFESDLDIGQVI